MNTTLYILLEGPDDENFFTSILEKKFKDKYNKIKIIKYQRRMPKDNEALLKTLIAGKKDYIIFGDFDNFTCFTAAKKSIRDKFIQTTDLAKIIVVKTVIEGWYLAGISSSVATSFPITYFGNTDSITKNQFNSLIPKKYESRIDFMKEILKKYDYNLAINQNTSFNRFICKFIN